MIKVICSTLDEEFFIRNALKKLNCPDNLGSKCGYLGKIPCFLCIEEKYNITYEIEKECDK